MAEETPELFRKTYYGGTEEEEAIRIIMHRYGLKDSSTAVRFSLRMIAEPDTIQANLTAHKIKRVKRNL